VNIEHLRQSLKAKWLSYYRENRQWLAHLKVWVICDGQRRPSSSFILGTLAILEPRLSRLLPLIVDLNNHPDRIVISLGLNFNPEAELALLSNETITPDHRSVKMLPGSSNDQPSKQLPPEKDDESCRGARPYRD
jgi:hypothetical protein